MKDIWKKFSNTAKVSATDAWAKIKEVFSSTQDFFKTSLVDFVCDVGTCLTSTIKGLPIIFWNLLKTVLSGLLAAVLESLGALVTIIINQIKKL